MYEKYCPNFGSFGLTTKEPNAIMLFALYVVVGIIGIICAHLPATGLSIETLYLVQIYAPKDGHEMFSYSDLYCPHG